MSAGGQTYDAASRSPTQWRMMIAQIAARHKLRPGEIMIRTRRKPVSHARQEAMSALRDLGWSYPQIARVWGMDHTTALYGVRAFERRTIQTGKGNA